MFGEMDKDQSKSISLQEFVEYYSGHRTEARSEYLEIEDDDAAPRLGYNGIRKKIGIEKENCMILGEKFEEVKAA